MDGITDIENIIFRSDSSKYSKCNITAVYYLIAILITGRTVTVGLKDNAASFWISPIFPDANASS